jgi:hypothetical protein
MKRNSIILSAIVVIAIAFALYSCKDTNQPTNVAKIPTGIVYSVDPSNPDNPYDYVGVEHNECMEFMGNYKNYNLSSPESFDSSFFNALSEYSFKKGRNISADDYRSLANAMVSTGITQEDGFKLLGLSTTSIDIIEQILKQIDIKVTNSTILNEVITNIKLQESRFLLKPNFSSFEKEYLSKFSSICRFSTAYNYEISESLESSSWGSSFTMKTATHCDTVQTLCDKADARGFEKGAVKQVIQDPTGKLVPVTVSGAEGSNLASAGELAKIGAGCTNITVDRGLLGAFWNWFTNPSEW